MNKMTTLTGAGAESRDSTLAASQIHGRHNYTPAAGRARPGGRAALDGATRNTLESDSSGEHTLLAALPARETFDGLQINQTKGIQ